MWKILCSSPNLKCFSSVIFVPISMANEPRDRVLLIHTFVTSHIAYHKTPKHEATWCKKPTYSTKCSCWAVKQHRLPWTHPLSSTHPVPVFNCLQTLIQGLCTDFQSPLWKHYCLCKVASILSFSFFPFTHPSASHEKSVL